VLILHPEEVGYGQRCIHMRILPKRTCDSANLAILLGVGDDVRISRGRFAGLAKTILDYAQTEEGQHVFHNIRSLRNRFEPEVVAKEHALKKPRRAKASTEVYKALATDASWQMPPLQ
jgi:hypothetical protein